MVKAIGDRVFVRLEKTPEKTQGGIILTDDFHQSRTVGLVESVGEKVTLVKIGDKVLFHIFDDLPSYDENVVVVRENSILGVFENE